MSKPLNRLQLELEKKKKLAAEAKLKHEIDRKNAPVIIENVVREFGILLNNHFISNITIAEGSSILKKIYLDFKELTIEGFKFVFDDKNHCNLEIQTKSNHLFRIIRCKNISYCFCFFTDIL